jgi:hypothetical protein
MVTFEASLSFLSNAVCWGRRIHWRVFRGRRHSGGRGVISSSGFTFASIGEIMRNVDRPQKITFAEMREMPGLLFYCADYLCSHSCIGCTALSRPVRSKIPIANAGIVGASAPLRLVHGTYSRFDGKPVVIIRDLEHHLLAQLAAHLLGHGTGFFRSLVPIFGVV